MIAVKKTNKRVRKLQKTSFGKAIILRKNNRVSQKVANWLNNKGYTTPALPPPPAPTLRRGTRGRTPPPEQPPEETPPTT